MKPLDPPALAKNRGEPLPPPRREISDFQDGAAIDWRGFFQQFEALVVVANSPAISLASVRRSTPGNALFVFFNYAERVVGEEFEGAAIVVARSGNTGSAIVRRRRLPSIAAALGGGDFHGFVNLRVSSWETPDPIVAFTPFAAFPLDVVERFDSCYPRGRSASSGFAVVVWLLDLELGVPIHIVGFTGARSVKRRLFHVHDWTFEQTVLRLLLRRDKVRALDDETTPDPRRLERIDRIVAGAGRDEVVMVAAEVIADRLTAAEGFIDRLWSVTAIPRFFREILAFLRGRRHRLK